MNLQSHVRWGRTGWAALLILLLTAFSSAYAGVGSPSARVTTPHVAADLVSEHDAVVPGRAFSVGLRLQHIPHWHTYWRNPGDSGAPTALIWELPPGFDAGELQWPYPKRLLFGPLANFGYENRVMLLADIVAPERIAASAVTIKAKATWLVCSDICIPESGEFALHLPVAKASRPVSDLTNEFADARARLPARLEGGRFEARVQDDAIVMRMEFPTATDAPVAPVFFPFDEGKIEPSGHQQFGVDTSGYSLTIPRAQQPVGTFDRLRGVLVSQNGFGPEKAKAILVDTPVLDGPAPSSSVPVPDELSKSSAGTSMSFVVAIVFALAGGALLNFMPCVFPVLSIKLLSVVQHGERGPVRHQALAYACGVVLSFLLLAAVLLALRSTGQQIGWGFQLQSPSFVVSLALLFFVLGLNLSGVFEFAGLLPARLASMRVRNGSLEAGLSGLLAVLAASPCTAPFMGAALGYALSQSALGALSVFGALGIGMAGPFVLIAWVPRAYRWLPKAGPWMNRLRELLAFPLYGAVIWLTWVLGEQAGLDAVVKLLALLLLTALGVWFVRYAQTTGRHAGYRGGASGVLAGGFVLALMSGSVEQTQNAGVASTPWRRWSDQAVAEALHSGRPVFVDFTAAWCITCQVNEKLVLTGEAVQQAFKERGVVLLRADWTRQDPAITLSLERLGRKGVPVYVLHEPGRPPKLLPEILTQEIVLNALRG